MREACALLGNPERSALVLHVAGTNGKGSTCAFAEASFREAGIATGLYTGPHLRHFCERIRIAGEPPSEERACELLEEVRGRIPWALGDPGLTFFEIVTLMAFLAFREVDAAVIEVGLGGRLDATNVVVPRACAVSALGLEHTQYLGPTLAHVATEKAGIFKAGSPAVSAGQPRAAAEVLQLPADQLGIPLWRPGRDYPFQSPHDPPLPYAQPRSTHACARDSPRGTPPGQLAGIRPGQVPESAGAARDAARGAGGVVLCCGSLYLAGEIRALLLGVEKTPMPSERL